MTDFSTNTQKLRLAKEEFRKITTEENRKITTEGNRKITTEENRTITWKQSITIIQRICTSCSKTKIEEAIYEANPDLNDRISFDDFSQAVRRLVQEEGGDDTQMILPDETNVNDRLLEFAKELLELDNHDVPVTSQMVKELREKYNLPPSSP